MKKFILSTLVVLTIATSSSNAGWFTDDHQHEQQLQQQLQQEQHTNSNEGIAIVALGIGCVITLIVGTMIGSKCRRKANENKPNQPIVPLD